MTKTNSNISIFDLRIDLSDLIQKENIKSLSPIDLIELIIKGYFSYLDKPFGKTDSKIERDKELKTIIAKYYGIDCRAYSKEEIALLTDKTLERVRQQLISFNKLMLATLNDENEDFKIQTEVCDVILNFQKEISQFKVISKTKLKETLFLNFGIPGDKIKNEFLSILFDIIQIKERTPIAHHLRNNTFLFSDKQVSIDMFFEICYLVFIFLEKNTIATELEDIIIDVKRTNAKFPKELIEIACNQIEEIEQVVSENKNRYQLKFEDLSNAKDMAYRFLMQKGEFIKLAELIKEINHLLHKNKSKKRVTKSIASQLVTDNRFIAQGKSGFWGLTEWEGNNEILFGLISNTLLHYNKPLSKKDIFSHITKDRPKIPIKSLDTILYDKTRYSKLNNDCFILNEWRDVYKAKIVKTERRNTYIKSNPIKEQIKNQAIQLIKENGDETFYLNSIVNALNSKFGYSKAAVYGIIGRNDEFLKKEDDNGKKLVSLNTALVSDNIRNKTTSVFVSYCWENKQHQDKIVSFVEFLRIKGFNADLDVRIMQEETATDFNKLMHKGIKNYDKIIIILSEGYKRKAEAFEGGVGKEYRYIQNAIDKEPKKFIFASFIPLTTVNLDLITPLDFQSREVVDLRKDEKNAFQYLFSKLTDTKQYNFSDVASNTPLVETITIKPFTLSDY